MIARLRRIVVCLAVMQTCFAGAAEPAPAAAGQQISRAGSQPSAAGPEAFFTGRVRVEPVWPASNDIAASGAYVTFEPGARSAWHTHPAGQRLLIVSGTGRTQEWGKPVQELRAGDVVWCPPGVKHWHGASSTAAMTHLAVTGTVDGKNVQWMEKVSDDQYTASTSQDSRTMTQTPQKSETLSIRQQAIVPIAAFGAAGDIPRLSLALNQGLDAGLTVNDAKEVLVQLYAYAGFPRSLNALGELMKVIEARQQRGMQDAPGQVPGRPIPKGDALLAAGTANQTRLAGGPVKGALFEFAPAADEYLKTHLFGDIFERGNLDWQSRELATVAMLSALKGADSQLQSHMSISMNIGLTAGQLSQLIQVLADRVDAENARRARDALTAQLPTRTSQ